MFKGWTPEIFIPEQPTQRVPPLQPTPGAGMKQQRCPACKNPFELPTGPSSMAALVCASCGNAVLAPEGKLRLMTVREFIALDTPSQGVIRRAITRAGGER